MPKYFEYLRTLLPEITLWSKIVMGDLSRYGATTSTLPKIYSGMLNSKEEITNCYAELYFRIKKMDKKDLKIPIKRYIRKTWKNKLGFQRQFVDAYIACNNLPKRVTNLFQRKKSFAKKEVDVSNSEDEKKDDINEFEETWQESSTPVRSKRKHSFLEKPAKKVKFDPKSAEKLKTSNSPSKQSSKKTVKRKMILRNQLSSVESRNKKDKKLAKMENSSLKKNSQSTPQVKSSHQTSK